MEEDLLGSIARKSVASMEHADVIYTNHNTDHFQPHALCNDQSQTLIFMSHKLSVESRRSEVCPPPRGMSKNSHRVIRGT